MNLMQRLKKCFNVNLDDEKLYAPLKQTLLNNDYQTSPAWPEEYSKGVILTLNGKGFTCTYLNPAQKAFIKFAKNSPGPLVDMGCVYGVATRPAIANGGQVIAVDSSSEHLAILENSLPSAWKNQLKTMNKSFPSEVTFSSNSIAGILTSYLFPLLSPDELEDGLARCYDWLMPGGTFWTIQGRLNFSPDEPIQKLYNERKAAGEKHPGFINNYHDYLEKEWYEIFPNHVYFIDMDEMTLLLTNAGFEIVESGYYTQGFWQHLEVKPNDKGSYYIFARKPKTPSENSES